MVFSSKIAVLSALLGFCALGSSAVAAPRESTNEVVLAALPPGVELQVLNRYFFSQSNASGYHFSGWFLPDTWELQYNQEGVLGFVSKTSFPGSRPIYNCLISVPGKHPSPFTSTDANCEGYALNTLHGFTGYLSTTQIEGTVPLYRCRFVTGQPHHFDTHSPTCDGHPGTAMDGVLGYIFL
ncbi:hypothetical protein [Lysobacter sp. 1R34A]|uniref:hypothetical protein n=1 Tax=Lysobacter sp. 1R34A TaxID=3445786 RepID=UPI003EEA2A5B